MFGGGVGGEYGFGVVMLESSGEGMVNVREGFGAWRGVGGSGGS